MKQRQYSPLSVSEMGVSLFAVEYGFLDDVELEKVGAFEHALHSFMHSDRADLMKQIEESGDYNDEIEASLKESIENFKKNHTW